MTKKDFLAQLQSRLAHLSKEDAEERLSFYAEMIDDRVEEGLTEEEAVAAIGSIDEVAAQETTPAQDLSPVEKEEKPSRALRTRDVVLLAVGAPLWIPLVAAAIVVVLALYISAWAVVAALWVADVAFAISPLGGVICAIVFGCQGYGGGAAFMVACGLCCGGLSIFLFFGCKQLTKWVCLLTVKMEKGVKTFFKGRGAK